MSLLNYKAPPKYNSLTNNLHGEKKLRQIQCVREQIGKKENKNVLYMNKVTLTHRII